MKEQVVHSHAEEQLPIIERLDITIEEVTDKEHGRYWTVNIHLRGVWINFFYGDTEEEVRSKASGWLAKTYIIPTNLDKSNLEYLQSEKAANA